MVHAKIHKYLPKQKNTHTPQPYNITAARKKALQRKGKQSVNEELIKAEEPEPKEIFGKREESQRL